MLRWVNLDTGLGLLLAPLLAVQTLYVRRIAMQLPEPAGPRSGAVGDGPPLRLLILGDSSAAGVGVARQEEAMGPQLAGEISAAARRVTWQLCAKNGATSADAPNLLAAARNQMFDIAYVVLGVNDAKNLRPEAAWRRDLTDLVDRLRAEHGVRQIVFAGLPRVGDFPLLPHPLRAVLALRTARFDRALQAVAERLGCLHLPIDLPLDRAGMAEDGFHPGAPIYALWARVAGEGIRRIL